MWVGADSRRAKTRHTERKETCTGKEKGPASTTPFHLALLWQHTLFGKVLIHELVKKIKNDTALCANALFSYHSKGFSPERRRLQQETHASQATHLVAMDPNANPVSFAQTSL
mmetsp:Transcript_21508/g.62991  ORF Transcript_21508/g.62991 Transcript_21508/m.62991 type:complete len:113 (-) Transcript_21508:681-1019(-)